MHAQKEPTENQTTETFVSRDKASFVADKFFSGLVNESPRTRSTNPLQQEDEIAEVFGKDGEPLMYIVNYLHRHKQSLFITSRTLKP